MWGGCINWGTKELQGGYIRGGCVNWGTWYILHFPNMEPNTLPHLCPDLLEQVLDIVPDEGIIHDGAPVGDVGNV